MMKDKCALCDYSNLDDLGRPYCEHPKYNGSCPVSGPIDGGKIHLAIWKSDHWTYLCNEACGTTPRKCATAKDLELVTCLNCLDRVYRKIKNNPTFISSKI